VHIGPLVTLSDWSALLSALQVGATHPTFASHFGLAYHDCTQG